MSAYWSADATSTAPPSYVTNVEESVTLSCDVTALLVSGGAPAVAATPAKLYRIVNDAADVEITGLAATTVAGNILSQLLPALVARETYKLRWRFVTSGNTRTCTTVIVVAE